MLCGNNNLCVVDIDTVFINHPQLCMVDGCRSKMNYVESGVPQGPLLFLLYTSELFQILENKRIRWITDSTLMSVVPPSGVKSP